MRGEHFRIDPYASTMLGSSPHAWGAFPKAFEDKWIRRFIPTCVGSIVAGLHRASPDSVHPHMRGEHLAAIRSASARSGSSPHAWGASAARAAPAPPWRFIPTCVGSIRGYRFAGAGNPVHPHMRGEHGSGYSSEPCSTVHPHMRGEHTRTVARVVVPSVHPHMRGEH